jgi:erythromycin esterase-like protein
MGDDRVIELIGRIDRALARIEAASARSAAPPAADDGRTAAIAEAHRALRAKVESAIAQIDRLIAAGEQG